MGDESCIWTRRDRGRSCFIGRFARRPSRSLAAGDKLGETWRIMATVDHSSNANLYATTMTA